MFDHQEELDQYLENIEALIKNKQYARLRDLFLPMEPADIALLLEEAGEEEMPLLYRLLPKELAAEVFVELESDSQEMLINGFSNTELKEVLDELYLDDAVDYAVQCRRLPSVPIHGAKQKVCLPGICRLRTAPRTSSHR